MFPILYAFLTISASTSSVHVDVAGFTVNLTTDMTLSYHQYQHGGHDLKSLHFWRHTSIILFKSIISEKILIVFIYRPCSVYKIKFQTL